MADTDPLAAELDKFRRFLDGGNAGEWYAAGRMLLAAANNVLAPHKPRTDTLLGHSCSAHRSPLPGCGKPTLRPVPGCGNCAQDEQREVCPECRDEYGDPVPFEKCRARSAILAGLTGTEDSDGG